MAMAENLTPDLSIKWRGGRTLLARDFQPGAEAGTNPPRLSGESDKGRDPVAEKVQTVAVCWPDGGAAGWHNTERHERLKTVADSALTTNAPANRLRVRFRRSASGRPSTGATAACARAWKAR